jgi:hypothetical protein
LSPDDLRFARVVYLENPDCRLNLLVAEGSMAAKALAGARIALQRRPVGNDASATAASVQTPMIRMDGDAEGDREVDAFAPLQGQASPRTNNQYAIVCNHLILKGR